MQVKAKAAWTSRRFFFVLNRDHLAWFGIIIWLFPKPDFIHSLHFTYEIRHLTKRKWRRINLTLCLMLHQLSGGSCVASPAYLGLAFTPLPVIFIASELSFPPYSIDHFCSGLPHCASNINLVRKWLLLDDCWTHPIIRVVNRHASNSLRLPLPPLASLITPSSSEQT